VATELRGAVGETRDPWDEEPTVTVETQEAGGPTTTPEETVPMVSGPSVDAALAPYESNSHVPGVPGSVPPTPANSNLSPGQIPPDDPLGYWTDEQMANAIPEPIPTMP